MILMIYLRTQKIKLKNQQQIFYFTITNINFLLYSQLKYKESQYESDWVKIYLKIFLKNQEKN